VESGQHAQGLPARQDALRQFFGQDGQQLAAKAGSADAFEVGEVAPQQALRGGLEAEAEPALVAETSEHARRIVLEAAIMEDAETPRRQVLLPAVRVQQAAGLSSRQGEGHGVDGEVAARQVSVDRGRADGG